MGSSNQKSKLRSSKLRSPRQMKATASPDEMSVDNEQRPLKFVLLKNMELSPQKNKEMAYCSNIYILYKYMRV